jgi:D-beta-D-heptose 7-phosphate kinase/D-beta-D-heptose 1-phosphate adenosyltransferase
MVSGGFDPLHIGHVNLLEAASEHGRVIVALNSDDWLVRKKGFALMPWVHRARILTVISVIHQVVPVDDADGTVCDAVRRWTPDYFCNGGNRMREDESPEARLCDSLGITRLYNVGGAKIESSSALIHRVQQ